ncbi:MAG: ZmpA/ZmpB/ZmpC family metallo-endopeptidase-related protein [Emergencia sp.]
MNTINRKLISALLSLILIFTVSFAGTSVYAGEGTAISTAEDLKAMENNPSGSYYLTADIEVPENLTLFTSSKNPFTGTLDGRGHALKNYSITTSENTALFCEAQGATFRNIKVTGFKASIRDSIRSTYSVAGLVKKAENCSFTDISTSGAVTISTPNLSEYAVQEIGGIVANATSCTFKKCTNKISISVVSTAAGGHAAGVAASGFYNKFTSCTNAAPVKVNGGGTDDLWIVCGITAGSSTSLNSCRNKSEIKYVATPARWAVDTAGAAGVAFEADSLTDCSNSGKVSVDTSALSGMWSGDYVGAAGVACRAFGVKRCSNTGAVSYKGVGGRVSGGVLDTSVGGVVGHKGNYTSKPQALTECYNKGKVTVSLTEGSMNAGGVAGDILGAASNCYNTGAISLNKGYCVGGVFGYLDAGGKTVSGLYNKGKVTGGGDSKIRAAAIAGLYEVPYSKNTVKNTYYTSGKGIVNASYVKSQQAKPKKVSSITFKNCPGLSSKYWTYSSKFKRLILKNNKEI